MALSLSVGFFFLSALSFNVYVRARASKYIKANTQNYRKRGLQIHRLY